MNILMLTNTYKPLVGGLERSVEAFSREFRKLGHRVIIVAPEFEDMQPDPDVIRIPAIQNFNGSDFSVQLPIPGVLPDALGDFKPDIVHAHHPFLIGDTALRIAYKNNVPLIYTYHTAFEYNLHYVPIKESTLKKFVIELSTGYANLADHVFAPSESIKAILQERGVTTPIDVIPTGIDLKSFSHGKGQAFRRKHGIPLRAFVVGYVGRLAPEKNLEFLATAVARFIQKVPQAVYMVAGKGPSEAILREIFSREKVEKNLFLVGTVTGTNLSDCYHAMDVFAFALQSETQGLVLAEAMACRVPVVAVDAAGVREVVKDEKNGRLLSVESMDDFVAALEWIHSIPDERRREIQRACRQTASEFAMNKIVKKVGQVYFSLILKDFVRRPSENSVWENTLRLIKAQWDLTRNLTKATGTMLLPESAPEPSIIVEPEKNKGPANPTWHSRLVQIFY